MSRVLIALVMAVALLTAPALAYAQSAGDEQYVDPFQGSEGGGQQEPAPQPEQPAEQPAEPAPTAPAEPAPAAPAEPAPGGNGTAEPAPAPEAKAAQPASPTLPRTGAPVALLAAIGYGLLVAGVAIRRKA